MNLIRLLVAFGIAICAALPVSAQIAQVRSGDHSEFARLVIYLPKSTTWSVEEGEGTARIVTSPVIDFDVSGVYDRIGRDRLTRVRQSGDGTALELSYICDCELRTQTLAGNVLVVDLVGNRAAPPILDKVDQEEPVKPMAKNPTPKVMPDAPKKPRVPMLESRRRTDELTRSLPDAQDKSETDQVDRLAQMERTLIEQISRSATQGLLVPGSLPRPDPNPAYDEPKKAQNKNENMQKPDQNDGPGNRDGGLRTDNSLLKGQGDMGLEFPVTSNGAACYEDEALDLTTWQGDKGFAEGIGEYRAALTGEFDRPNEQAALDMAKFYISYGFGAEAIGALRMMETPTPEAGMIASMARILEWGFDPYESPFSHQLDCDSHAAFWATLSHESLTGDFAPEKAAIMRTLNVMPLNLRQYLGPILADRFLGMNDTETAQSIMRIVDRAGENPESRGDLAKGKLQLESGDLDAARESLNDVIGQNSDISPEALIALVEADLAAGLPVSSDTAELVSAFALQFRNTPIEVELLALEILARAGAGQYDAAFASLREKMPRDMDRDKRADLRSRVSALMVNRADDQIFLRHGLEIADDQPADLDAKTGNQMAQRFLDLGFPDQAAEFVKSGADGPLGRERLFLRARIALAAGRPRRAEAELVGLQGPEADRIRAIARADIGDHLAASKFFAELDDQTRADQQAWLAGEWQVLAQSQDNLQASVATLMTPPEDAENPDGEAPGELARNRQLLQETLSSRETLENLLDRYQVAVAGDQ